ncbi:hypothetical protein V5O48_011556 [Marasmius crinis-equi]|uniref:Lysine-specific metallo-endopeptidase domain-containing protein n=1 Tax=Marasmius crinis-equi TaxID=585013 RepID=A0ABR3F5D8_9AGAR
MFSRSVRLAVTALALSALSVRAEPSLSLKLSGPPSVDGVHNLKVVATLFNTGSDTIKLLNDPRGLLSKASADKFTISNGAGSAPSFTGIKVKYSPGHAAKHGGDSGYTVLKAGESVQVEHDLSKSYDFEQSGEGSYDIHGHQNFHYHDEATNEVKTVTAKIESSHKAKIAGKLAVRRSLSARQAGNSTSTTSPIIGSEAGYANCSAQEAALVHAASVYAQIYSFHSYEYLVQNNHSGAARYETWFGAYDVARHQNLTKHFARVLENPFSNYTYDCHGAECPADGGTFAYVFPDQFGTIYLCQSFWKANITGADSKAGTLVHESTHFTIVAGTTDENYGRNSSRNLAVTNPAAALVNADSHEYFAEDSDPITATQAGV